MWYVVQTVGGQEKQVLDLLEKLIGQDLVQEAFVPQYEVKKRIRGEWRMRTEVLLPGYLFVVTDDPGKLRDELRSVPKFTRLLANNDVFVPLNDQEVAFINAFTKPGRRVVGFSNGVMEGDEIVILNGPLMHQAGLVKKVDRHKRLAYLEMEMLGRKKTVKVGLEIVQKRP
ncbi:MAG TPA: antiterminator LoaP [Candidatus Rubneribacter avistercoris]|nr:antiterminator LoaP [Candidatus Rubneribacter avistercoris]